MSTPVQIDIARNLAEKKFGGQEFSNDLRLVAAVTLALENLSLEILPQAGCSRYQFVSTGLMEFTTRCSKSGVQIKSEAISSVAILLGRAFENFAVFGDLYPTRFVEGQRIAEKLGASIPHDLSPAIANSLSMEVLKWFPYLVTVEQTSIEIAALMPHFEKVADHLSRGEVTGFRWRWLTGAAREFIYLLRGQTGISQAELLISVAELAQELRQRAMLEHWDHITAYHRVNGMPKFNNLIDLGMEAIKGNAVAEHSDEGYEIDKLREMLVGLHSGVGRTIGEEANKGQNEKVHGEQLSAAGALITARVLMAGQIFRLCGESGSLEQLQLTGSESPLSEWKRDLTGVELDEIFPPPDARSYHDRGPIDRIAVARAVQSFPGSGTTKPQLDAVYRAPTSGIEQALAAMEGAEQHLLPILLDSEARTFRYFKWLNEALQMALHSSAPGIKTPERFRIACQLLPFLLSPGIDTSPERDIGSKAGSALTELMHLIPALASVSAESGLVRSLVNYFSHSLKIVGRGGAATVGIYLLRKAATDFAAQDLSQPLVAADLIRAAEKELKAHSPAGWFRVGLVLTYAPALPISDRRFLEAILKLPPSSEILGLAAFTQALRLVRPDSTDRDPNGELWKLFQQLAQLSSGISQRLPAGDVGYMLSQALAHPDTMKQLLPEMTAGSRKAETGWRLLPAFVSKLTSPVLSGLSLLVMPRPVEAGPKFVEPHNLRAIPFSSISALTDIGGCRFERVNAAIQLLNSVADPQRDLIDAVLAELIRRYPAVDNYPNGLPLQELIGLAPLVAGALQNAIPEGLTEIDRRIRVVTELRELFNYLPLGEGESSCGYRMGDDRIGRGEIRGESLSAAFRAANRAELFNSVFGNLFWVRNDPLEVARSYSASQFKLCCELLSRRDLADIKKVLKSHGRTSWTFKGLASFLVGLSPEGVSSLPAAG